MTSPENTIRFLRTQGLSKLLELENQFPECAPTKSIQHCADSICKATGGSAKNISQWNDATTTALTTAAVRLMKDFHGLSTTAIRAAIVSANLPDFCNNFPGQPLAVTSRAAEQVQAGAATGAKLRLVFDATQAEIASLTPQVNALRTTADALWHVIERNYSTETENDRVGVPWMQMTLPRHEWRQKVDAMRTDVAALDTRLQDLHHTHATLSQQLAKLQDETLTTLRQIYASDATLTADAAEYLSQSQAQMLAAMLSDWTRSLAANATLQRLLPHIGMPSDALPQAQTDLQLQQSEWMLRNGPENNFLKILSTVVPHTTTQELRKALLQAQYEVSLLSSGKGNLNAAIAALEVMTSRPVSAATDSASLAVIAQAHVLHTSIAAAKAAQIRDTEGSAAFDRYFQKLSADVDSFEKSVSTHAFYDQVATTHLQLVKVLWAAHRYQEAFAAAAQVQRQYPGSTATQELDAPQSWLYRVRPDAYAPGGLIRENLDDISFEGLGAAYREAWAHTNENSSLAQYGLPVLGCVAGAAVASKFGAAAGTAAGPEGTVLGFGAGAATGCGLGAIAGKVVDWATSAITAPEVAQAMATGHSENTWGMTWVQMNFAAVDVASTYLLGKTLWHPALGLAQGTVDIGAGITHFGKYAITQPGAALADLGTGLLTSVRVSAAITQSLAQQLIAPVSTLKTTVAAARTHAAQLADTVRGFTLESYAHAASIAANMGLAGMILYPASASARTTEKYASKFDAMWEAAKKPGILEWAVSMPVFFFGTWAAARMLWLDKVIAKPLIWSAFKNEAHAHFLLKIMQNGKIGFIPALWQSTLLNAPWIYQQMEADNVKPFKMSIGSFSDVFYVVGSMLSRAIVQQRNGGRSMTIAVEGRSAEWLRKKGIVDLQKLVWRDYIPFFAWNTAFATANNMSFGLYFTDGEVVPWTKRCAAQPIPMFPRKIVTVFLGISTPAALTVDWFLNTYENRMLTWFFPPWSGKKNWMDRFNAFDTSTSWDAMMVHYDDKMEYGTLQLPQHSDTLPFGRRLLPRDFADFDAELNKGTLESTAINVIATQVIARAAPERFASSSAIEKRLVLIHLAIFSKQSHSQAAQQALAPHLRSMGFKTMAELLKTPVQNIAERLNDQNF